MQSNCQKCTYLGIEMFPSIQTIVKHHFGNTLNKIISDLDSWMFDGLRCWIHFTGKYQYSRLKILLRAHFFSSMLPLPPSPQYWSKLQTASIKFLWWGKWTNFPNFKHYNWAITLRPLLTWLLPEASVLWYALKESLVSPYSLQDLLYSNMSITQGRHKFSPIVSQLFSVWRAAEKLCGCLFAWNPCSPLFNNARILKGGHPIQFSCWKEREASVHLRTSLETRVCPLFRTYVQN